MTMPSHKIKVLIADDSFFMRKLTRRLLEEAGDFEVVGEAKDGVEAVELAKHLRPDVMTMDYNMPLLTGAMATRQIVMEVKPAPAIVMLSAYTKEGAEETLESLRAGAVDFVCKPSGELSLDIDKVAVELLAKLRLASHSQVQRLPEFLFQKKVGLRISAKRMGKVARKGKTPAWLIVIGASTGGPPVIEEVVTHLNNNLPAAILIVQHMPPHFTKSFAERLEKMSELNVREAVDGDKIGAGLVLIAPGDYHMVLKYVDGEYIVKLNQEPPRDGLRPSIDVLFESVAPIWKNRVMAVELTGMGEDGCNGIEAIRKIGGFIIAQSKETTVVNSMPWSVVAKGLADAVLAPIKIAEKINSLCK